MKILPTILSINPHREFIIKDHEYKLEQTKSAIGLPIEHDSARMHVQGGAQYIDDIPEPNGTLHVAFALSNVANGKIKSVDVSFDENPCAFLIVCFARGCSGCVCEHFRYRGVWKNKKFK